VIPVRRIACGCNKFISAYRDHPARFLGAVRRYLHYEQRRWVWISAGDGCMLCCRGTATETTGAGMSMEDGRKGEVNRSASVCFGMDAI